MIFFIAFNTFKEAIRQRLILFASLIALGLILASRYLLRLDLGHDQIRFVFDFSSGALNFFGTIIAVVCSCSLISSEIENKTIITLLSKSVNSLDFVLGKLVGIMAVLFVFVMAIFASASVMLWVTSLSLSNAGFENIYVNYISFVEYCILQWLKISMCASFSILICSLSRSFLFAVSMSFMCVLICIMGETLAGLGGNGNLISNIASYLLPDFQLLDVSENVLKTSLAIKTFSLLCLYGGAYVLISSLLSAWVFSKRDF